MNRLIQIGNQQISAKEFKGQRVVTLKDIDLVHERPEGTARRNYNTNKKHLIEGEDYFVRNSSEAQSELGITAPNGLVLMTEQGYLMLVKSFTDDLAWKVQRQLVNTYFKASDFVKNLSTEMKAILMHDEKIVKIENRMDKLEFDIPLYGSEADELSSHVKRKGVAVLGGKKSEAYKDNNIRSKVYRDIYDQIKREFGIYSDDGKPKSYKALKRKYLYEAHECIDMYEVPMYLKEMIDNANAQISLNEIA